MDNRKKVIGVLAAMGMAVAWSPARADDPKIPLDPTIADKRAFVAAMFQYIGKSAVRVRNVPKLHSEDIPVCAEVTEELRKGNYTFLEPAAFDKSKKPPEVVAIEKQCPNLMLGESWADDHDVGEKLHTEQDWINEYGEPWRATRNFTLYQVPLPNSETMPVFYADRICRNEENCNEPSPSFEMINVGSCEKEGKLAASPGEQAMTGLVNINHEIYMLESHMLFPNMNTVVAGIMLLKMPTDVVPTRPGGEMLYCAVVPERARQRP